MFDLDKLIPAGSSLKLSHALAITDRGEIVGLGVPPGCPRSQDEVCGHAYVLIPRDEDKPESGDQAAEPPTTQTQLPETQQQADEVTLAPDATDRLADKLSLTDEANTSQKSASLRRIGRPGSCSRQGAEYTNPRLPRCCPGLVCEITGLRGFCTSKPF
jgi:hypothetical protein